MIIEVYFFIIFGVILYSILFGDSKYEGESKYLKVKE